MAISVGRVPHHSARAEHFIRYGTRLAAFAAYACAVVVALALLAPLFGRSSETTEPLPASTADAVVYEVRPGDTLGFIAARHGVSVARVLALNPKLEPLRLEPGTRLRVG